MAGVSKVSYGDEVIIDLTSDTVTRQTLLSGVTAHAANGDQIVGALALGALAYLNSISYNSNYLTDKPKFGTLASRDFIEYSSSFLTNKPDFHKLAFQDFIDYNSEQLKNKPVFGELAFENIIDYEGERLINKPTPLGDVIREIAEIYPDLPAGIQMFASMASGGLKFPEDILSYRNGGVVVNDPYVDWFTYYYPDNYSYGVIYRVHDQLSDFVKIDYNSDQIYNKPTPVEDIIATIIEVVPDIPYGVVMAVYSAGGILKFDDSIVSYENNGIVFNENNVRGVRAAYESETSSVAFSFTAQPYITDAPNDGKIYGRRNGEWVELQF